MTALQTTQLGRGQPHSIDLVKNYYKEKEAGVPPTLEKLIEFSDKFLSIITLEYMIGDLDLLRDDMAS